MEVKNGVLIGEVSLWPEEKKLFEFKPMNAPRREVNATILENGNIRQKFLLTTDDWQLFTPARFGRYGRTYRCRHRSCRCRLILTPDGYVIQSDEAMPHNHLDNYEQFVRDSYDMDGIIVESDGTKRGGKSSKTKKLRTGSQNEIRAESNEESDESITLTDDEIEENSSRGSIISDDDEISRSHTEDNSDTHSSESPTEDGIQLDESSSRNSPDYDEISPSSEDLESIVTSDDDENYQNPPTKRKRRDLMGLLPLSLEHENEPSDNNEDTADEDEDTPNELCNRLRRLLRSYANRTRRHTRRISSIIEELRTLNVID